MTVLTHIYVHGDAGNVALRELAEKALTVESRRLDLAGELRDLASALDDVQERTVSGFNYISVRLGTVLTGLEELARRLGDLEAKITGRVAPSS